MVETGMKLIDIFNNINNKSPDWELPAANSKQEVETIVLSSLEAGRSSIFTAIKGFKTDGHRFIADAYNRGCRSFVVEESANLTDEMRADSTIVLVKDSREALALISNHIYGEPYRALKMFGVTGTKGKTTVTTLLYNFLKSSFRASMFSTIRYIVGGNEELSERTTMEANRLEALLAESRDCGDDLSVVEVSSHAVTLKRIEGVQWDTAIFTSFSRDHLDLYGTMERYFDAKLEFFRFLNRSDKSRRLAVVNIDDPKGEEVCRVVESPVRLIRVGRSEKADYRIKGTLEREGMLEISLLKGEQEYLLKSWLRGEFNVTNITLAFAAALENGVPYEQINSSLAEIRGVEGRFEVVAMKPFQVIVDYAHTPDSLRNILNESRQLCSGKIRLVFGCTGDRDRDKREIMGEIAAELADYSIISNDDTYTEEPQAIANQVEQGFITAGSKRGDDYEVILDRKDAIGAAIRGALPGDLVLLAGMGHEKVQILNEGKVPHNDRETALQVLASLK